MTFTQEEISTIIGTKELERISLARDLHKVHETLNSIDALKERIRTLEQEVKTKEPK